MARPSRTGGKTSATKTRRASPAEGRKANKTKHRSLPTAARTKRSTVSNLSKELKEAREQQAATADILKVIASSPSNLRVVFDAIAQQANRLIGGHVTAVVLFNGDIAELGGFTPLNEFADATLQATFPRPIKDFLLFKLVRSGETAQIFDIETEARASEQGREMARAAGFRSQLLTPLIGDPDPIGVIAVTRKEPGAFDPHHVQLLRTFADQAVIAIENTRLFNETQEALERQTATAEILNVIASSPSDVQPVFEAIVGSAKRLLGGRTSSLYRIVDGMLQLEATTSLDPESDQALRRSFPVPASTYPQLALVQKGESFQFADTEKDAPEIQIRIARLRGFRSILLTPLVHNRTTIGLVVVTRAEVGSFADHHVNLMRTFADQAVIAIENTRLFNETREALERQTATAEILKAIASSPDDVQPVFETIAESARRLCGGHTSIVTQVVGDQLELRASSANSEAGAEEVR